MRKKRTQTCGSAASNQNATWSPSRRTKMQLLHIVATPRGLASNTVRVSNVLLESLLEKYEHLTVRTLDLFNADLPSVAGKNIESKYMLMTGQALDDSSRSSWRQIEKNIEQFLE